MATLQEERRLAINETINLLKVITIPAIIKGAADMLASSNPNLDTLPAAVYGVVKHYEKIGRLVKVPDTYPTKYTINEFIEDRKEQKDLLKNLSGEEMAEVFRTWIRNYELKPEAAKKYQHKIAELTEEIKKLKAAHEQALNHAKAEYKKVADKLNSFMALAKS